MLSVPSSIHIPCCTPSLIVVSIGPVVSQCIDARSDPVSTPGGSPGLLGDVPKLNLIRDNKSSVKPSRNSFDRAGSFRIILCSFLSSRITLGFATFHLIQKGRARCLRPHPR